MRDLAGGRRRQVMGMRMRVRRCDGRRMWIDHICQDASDQPALFHHSTHTHTHTHTQGSRGSPEVHWRRDVERERERTQRSSEECGEGAQLDQISLSCGYVQATTTLQARLNTRDHREGRREGGRRLCNKQTFTQPLRELAASFPTVRCHFHRGAPERGGSRKRRVRRSER
jgi:hypothetical protein